MSLSFKTNELRRLATLFESEAAKFHSVTFALEFLSPESPGFSRPIGQRNHAITLWQFYGFLNAEDDTDRFAKDVFSSDLKWGIRGAHLTCLGLIEGDQYDLFVRMGMRAGALFDNAEVTELYARLTAELTKPQEGYKEGAKPVGVLNHNPLAIWLNYLLYHLSQAYPGRERMRRIEPDPFSLSLLAIDQILASPVAQKMDPVVNALVDRRFRVALSFPGEHRPFVAEVARQLESALGPDAVFYDLKYQAHLARPNLDILLQNVYRRQSDLVVVFLCDEYSKKDWCGLEWRAVRDLIKARQDDHLMLVRLDDSELEGMFSIDGFVDARALSPSQLVDLVLTRVGTEWGRRGR